MKVRIFIALTLLVGCSVDVPKVQLPTGVACQSGSNECEAYVDYSWCQKVGLPGYGIAETCQHANVPDPSGDCDWVHVHPKYCVTLVNQPTKCCVD